MKKLTFIVAIFVICLSFQSASAQKEKDRNTFISNAKLLEKKPFDTNAQAVRDAAFKWVADTDEVSVTLCSDIMKLIPEKKNKFKGELLMQFTFGVAVFKLENPDKKNDESAANLAGIESMLRTYQVMVKEKEKAKNAELDSLVTKLNNNELKAVVDAAKCK